MRFCTPTTSHSRDTAPSKRDYRLWGGCEIHPPQVFRSPRAAWAPAVSVFPSILFKKEPPVLLVAICMKTVYNPIIIPNSNAQVVTDLWILNNWRSATRRSARCWTLFPRLLAASRLITAGTGQVFLPKRPWWSMGTSSWRGEMYVFNETPDGKASYWMTMRAPTSISDIEVLSGQRPISPTSPPSPNVRCSAVPLRISCPFSVRDIDFL